MTEEKIISRIQKLLALANDLAATEGERDNALRMAYATMAKHNIEMARVENQGKAEPRIDFENQSFSWLWAKQVNAIIGDLFFCKVYIDGRKVNGTQCLFHFIGRESNAMTASVMADWIVKSILKEGRSLYKQNTDPRTRSFAVGAMHALSARVQEIKRSQATVEGTGNALVLASLYDTEKAENEAMLPENLKKARSVAHKVRMDAYSAGHEFGQKINLNKQVGDSTPEHKKLK